ncbi:MAG: zinc ABC transporter substrate-binding protein [Pseudomonadota bacterium]
MPRLPRLALAALLALAPALAAAAPRVAVDIAPVHSLAAMVMKGAGAPELILPPGASPHGHALRPSEAKALAQAEIVFHVGAGLAPWLDETLETLAPDATRLELAEVEGVRHLPLRERPVFADAEEDHAQGAGHGHDEDGNEREADHAHGPRDPHLWLNPDNAQAWLTAMAGALAEADPANAALYAANAEAARARLKTLSEQIDAALAPVRGKPFVVFHDAYRHFETRFDIPAAAAVSLGDARRPGARRVSEIRALLESLGEGCVFAEPQFEPRLLDTLTQGTEMRTATLDPVGADLAPGPDLYPQLLENLATSLAACLSR